MTSRWAALECCDIEFDGISPSEINRFVRETLGISASDVRHSNLYSDKLGCFAYTDDTDLSDHVTGTLHAETVMLDRAYHNAVCLFAHGESGIALTCSLPEEELGDADLPALTAWMTALCRAGVVLAVKIESESRIEPLFRFPL